ncbi:MAG: 2-oxoglutarate dehydrogenase complex dihydrolipoyllysine-residue succinyltransferase [Gemmataceae bacterium]
MAIEVKVPAVGESITEGRIARWLKPHGATVQARELLFEMETDKAAQEIPAPATGVLHIVVKEGEVVKVGQLVATIDPAGATAPATASTPAAPAPQKPASVPMAEPILSPAARAHVANNHLDASTIPGTGPGGRVIKDDVLAAMAKAPVPVPAATAVAPVAVALPPIPTPTAIAPATATPASSSSKVVASGPRETRTAMTMIRRRIAARLLESQNTTATLTTFNEADMTAIQDLRAKYNERYEKKHGVKLGFMSVFVKAVVQALQAFPNVNARIDGDDIIQQHFYDVGVAVSTEKGLMVPIIRDADHLSFAEIEKAIADVAKRARDGKVNIKEMEGGTFTITNGGTFGSMMSTPILNPPQTAILGMHAIQKRAVVVNDAIVIRPMMYLALSYDHRLIDGREAVQFLVRIKDCVENPERMLLEI